MKTYRQSFTLFLFAIIFSSYLNTFGQMTPSYRLNSFITENKDLEKLEIAPEKKTETGSTIAAVKKEGYTTPNFIEWIRLKKEKEKKKEAISKLQSALSNDASGKTPLTPDARTKTQADIKKTNNEIKQDDIVLDSVWLSYVSDFLDYKHSVIGFDSYRSLALYNIMKGDDKGNPFRFVSSASLNFGPNTSSLSSELFTGAWSFFHISFGSMITASSTEDKEKAKKEEAIQRLAQNGGNTYLKLEYPLWYLHTNTTIRVTALVRTFVKGTADLPNFGTQSNSFATSGSYGGDIYLNFGAPLKGYKVDKDRSLNAFIYFNFGRYKGSNEYKDNLGIETTAFNYGQLGAGIVFNNTVKLSFIFNSLSSVKSLRSGRVIGGGELLN